MWWFRRYIIFQRYSYFRRFRPWYGYPFRRCCFFSKRFMFTPWFFNPWYWLFGGGIVVIIWIF